MLVALRIRRANEGEVSHAKNPVVEYGYAYAGDDSLENGRARRRAEAQVRQEISDWHTEYNVLPGVARFVTVRVPLGAPCVLGMHTHAPFAEVTVPIDPSINVWTPRVSPLLWDESKHYIWVLRNALCSLSRNGSSGVVETASMCSDAFETDESRRNAIAAANQSLHRALVCVYRGRVRRDQGKLVVPDTTSRIDRVGGKRRRVGMPRSEGERLLRERAELAHTFGNLGRTGHQLPGCATSEAQTAMLDAYILARLAAPRRGSIANLVAMRVAVFLYVLLPHLVPLAPDNVTAEALSLGADDQLRAISPAGYEQIVENATRKRAGSRSGERDIDCVARDENERNDG